MMSFYKIYILSFIISAIGAFAITKLGHKLSLTDIPNERSSHSLNTPKGGGIGILVAFAFCSLALPVYKTLWIPAVIVSLLSLGDDIREISVKIRLIVQIACCIFFLAGVLLNRYVPGNFYLLFPILPVVIVGTMNFYNFMDGIDGIAAITGVIAFGFLSYYGSINARPYELIVLSISVSIACFGFLLFNFPYAKVFMGDVGAILLGFLFAAISLLFVKRFIDVLCLSSFLFTFYSDELTTMAIRFKKGEKLSSPHRQHLFQILANEYKIPHWKVSLFYGGVQLFAGLTVILLRYNGPVFIFFLLLFYFIIFSIATYYIRKRAINNALRR